MCVLCFCYVIRVVLHVCLWLIGRVCWSLLLLRVVLLLLDVVCFCLRLFVLFSVAFLFVEGFVVVVFRLFVFFLSVACLFAVLFCSFLLPCPLFVLGCCFVSVCLCFMCGDVVYMLWCLCC